MKYTKSILIAAIVGIIASVVLIPNLQQTTTAESPDIETNDSVNDVALRVIFHFRAGDEEINTFKVFKQLGGYDKTTSPTFELEGIVDGRKQMLYDATHAYYHDPVDPPQYGRFGVDIYLSDGASTNTHFIYEKCGVKNYFMETLFDKEETYNGKTKFAYIEHFEFVCDGYHPLHPVESQVTVNDTPKTESTMDLTKKSTPTWEDYLG